MKPYCNSSIILILALALALPGAVRAQGIVSPTWSSTIAYFNPNENADPTLAAAEMSVIYYKDAGGTETSGALTIKEHQSGVLLVGSTANFKGSAVVSSDKPLLAVYKQDAIGKEAYSPILYTSFDISQTGTGVFYLPAIQRNEMFDTQVAVQNIESSPIKVSLDFYDKDGTKTSIADTGFPGGEISAQASRIFKASEISNLSNGFDGSLVITAKLSTAGTDARIVAVAQDIMVGGRQAYTYEGVNGGTQAIYMPSAMCQYGSSQQTSSYWVQNTGSENTIVSVDYYDNSSDTAVASQTITPDLIPGKRVVINVCDATGGSVTGKSLSAVIRSSNPLGSIAAIGKTISKDGIYTAFTGQQAPDSSIKGSDNKYRVVVPYVEYATNKRGYKTYISVQNTGSSPATDVVAKYYQRDGGDPVEHGLDAIQPGSMQPTNASLARAIASGSRGFFGAVVIQSSQPVVAVVRVQFAANASDAAVLGEDYTGLLYKKP
jgi:hypothetical protein